MTLFKIDGINDYLEVYEDKVVISPKLNYSLQENKIEKSSLIYYKEIFKIDFESAGKFTNGYIHFILKEKLAENVFADIHKEGCLFLFDFFHNEKMKNIATIITNKIGKPLDSQIPDTKKVIKELTDIKELHQKGALTKKQYDEQMKNLIKRM